MTRSRWVTIEKYCSDTGETRSAVDNRRKRGIWLEGVHWSHPKGGAVMINTETVEEWIQQGSRSGAARLETASA